MRCFSRSLRHSNRRWCDHQKPFKRIVQKNTPYRAVHPNSTEKITSTVQTKVSQRIFNQAEPIPKAKRRKNEIFNPGERETVRESIWKDRGNQLLTNFFFIFGHILKFYLVGLKKEVSKKCKKISVKYLHKRRMYKNFGIFEKNLFSVGRHRKERKIINNYSQSSLPPWHICCCNSVNVNVDFEFKINKIRKCYVVSFTPSLSYAATARLDTAEIVIPLLFVHH